MKAARISKILVANRGEIAVRVIRAAKELGKKTVAIYSDADRDALHVKMADESVRIGPSPAKDSYLSMGGIISAAKDFGADAIHPGYGFLAESAEFADTVQSEGLIFIGPSAETIRSMGNKIKAREIIRAAGVPTVPGSAISSDSVEDALDTADAIGYPVLIKAAAGGGGRGIRICNDRQDLQNQWKIARSEAYSSFGSNETYVEKYIKNAKHIEVQILGDGVHQIHLLERDCSIQRKRQKVWEEAPAPILPGDVRAAIHQSAVDIARNIHYSGAGTIEYLFDTDENRFYFMEMNTRIQVEHGITEEITGIDIVKEMIKIAEGNELSITQQDVASRGASIQVRVIAEDPENNLLPNIGKISRMNWPSGPGVRVDHGLSVEYFVPPYYDGLLAKIIVHDASRIDALKRMARALDETAIEGLKTNIKLLQALSIDDGIMAGEFNTNYFEDWLRDNGYLKKVRS
ncbi:acetyl/propionyl/methylcrotonyl-CoA carboxylase subunit alpha [Castellaniella sp.]|uniref:acetyl-CoA carboxylase biotin carboxylase subunit n=1 Tax=Castellaniella sp. TaxID=1955812 RepID=UPI00356621E6